MVVQMEVKVKYISSHQMIVDPLTKPITCDIYEKYVMSLGLRRYLCI